MEAQIVAALEICDYKQVTQLLKQWQASEPTNPLLRLYAAQLQEKTNRLSSAEKNYLKLLKQTPGRKVMNQARAGLQRVQKRQLEKKALDLEKARTVEGGDESAILAIAAPAEPQRQQVIQGIAKVLDLDAYTARQKVPSAGFRLQRAGIWGDITYYQKALSKAQVPTLSAKISDIKALQTFQICYFEALSPQPTVVCRSNDGQLGKIAFDWAEVSQRVIGQLPIFEQVVDLGPWGKTKHKEQVQDYVQIVDFHLPHRQIVLRLCDRLYKYQQGAKLSAQPEINSRILWNQLLSQVAASTQSPQRDEFARFGKGALEFIPLLPVISPNLDIDRRAPSDWDIAFHLYSGLCYRNASAGSSAFSQVS